MRFFGGSRPRVRDRVLDNPERRCDWRPERRVNEIFIAGPRDDPDDARADRGGVATTRVPTA